MTSWTTPKTYVAGDILTAAEKNTYERDNLLYLYERVGAIGSYAIKVVRTSNQSIPDATDTSITWQSDLDANGAFDLGSWWSSGTTLTVPSAAVPTGYTSILVLYLCNIRFVTNSTGYRKVQILNNGAAQQGTQVGGQAADPTPVALSGAMIVAAGDAITAQATQTSGGALNMDTASLTVIRLFPVA